MTRDSVLIAALSGRALAASARRAGYTPLVVDAFGDADTRDAAGAVRSLPDATRTGFRAKSLLPALEDLARVAPRPPIGLVLGSGFEDAPKLVTALSRRFALIGNDADTIRRTKTPKTFFALLDALGIAHPETRLDPPRDPCGWLSKRIGASGGAHIVPCEPAGSRRRCYSQRRINGDAVSVLAVAGPHRVDVVGLSRQWTVGSGPRPHRYGGAAGPIQLQAGVEAHMIRAVDAVCRALDLLGLVSADFLIDDGVPHLLEVNPRPGATIDIFDSPTGDLFEAHIAACRGDPVQLPAPQPPRAAVILYAERGPLTAHLAAWPQWTCDRPVTGTRIPRYRPVATVLATAEIAATAEQKCRWRLDELAEMLYGRAPDRERNDAKKYRPRPERISASG